MTVPSDYRRLIHEELSHLEAWDSQEALDVETTKRWAESADELCRLTKPDVPNKHLVSYFLLRDGDHFLLVDHINAERWLPTGGHVDAYEHPRDTVRREAFEELGLREIEQVSAPAFITVTETVGKTRGHTDVSLWYVLSVCRDHKLVFDQSEFHSVRWFHRSELPWKRCEPNLARVLGKIYAVEADRSNHGRR